MITQPGKEITWGEMHVGARQVFLDAGFVEVSRPTARRVVMRIDFVHVADPLTAPRCHQGVSDRENPGRHINGARRRTGRLRSNRPAPWSTHPG
jgi:hypothetical protein